MHFSFLLLLGFVAWQGWTEMNGLRGAVLNVTWMLLFFTCVVLHELGHSFVAQAFGVRVPRIVLLPIGGMAEFASLPRRPSQEILIALAGPAVNFFIIWVLSFFTDLPSWNEIKSLEFPPLQLLLVMNLVMGCFNLLPAFPMDGGRVLRALFAQQLPYVTATRWAVAIGKVIASFGVVTMLFLVPDAPHFMGAVLFTFIIIAGELEYRAIRRQESEEQRWRELLDRLTPERPSPPA